SAAAAEKASASEHKERRGGGMCHPPGEEVEGGGPKAGAGIAVQLNPKLTQGSQWTQEKFSASAWFSEPRPLESRFRSPRLGDFCERTSKFNLPSRRKAPKGIPRDRAKCQPWLTQLNPQPRLPW